MSAGRRLGWRPAARQGPPTIGKPGFRAPASVAMSPALGTTACPVFAHPEPGTTGAGVARTRIRPDQDVGVLTRPAGGEIDHAGGVPVADGVQNCGTRRTTRRERRGVDLERHPPVGPPSPHRAAVMNPIGLSLSEVGLVRRAESRCSATGCGSARRGLLHSQLCWRSRR